MAKKKTPDQQFTQIFALFTTGATEGERAAAESKMDAWLKRHTKTRADIPSILAEALADDAASQPPPPQPDLRATTNPFDDPQFTPAGLVENILAEYVTMNEHAAVIYSLWICLTHVYQRFSVAPRVALVSEEPDSGKTTGLEVGRNLVFRPNPETLGTGAAVTDFLDQGPGTVMLDELDQVDTDARRRLQQIWNMGHKRGAQISLKVGGRRKLINIYAPMLAAGVGSFLAPTQKSRAFNLEMKPYTGETKPKRDYDNEDVKDLDAVYAYLRHWAAGVKLDPKPAMPPEVLRRFADNVRGILSIADSCGPEWGRRAREAVMFLLAQEKAEHPKMLILHHTLIIIDMLGLDPIPSRAVNKELRRLDLPEARWNRYRGPGGGESMHPLTLNEQAALMKSSDIEARLIRPLGGGKPFRGYWREWIAEAARERGPGAAPAHLRLITPRSD
jgi:Protein of unknown function (DUF3631)